MTWLFLYERAVEMSAEAIRDADRARLTSLAQRHHQPNVVARLRRAGALAAAVIAQRLDECAARDIVERRASTGSTSVS